MRIGSSDNAQDTPGPKYRPDIDGLRAIAVLSVLFYHLGLTAFSGGFVGVDVFFVISGFLITRLIRDEVSATGALSFRRFYTRRVRRLLPAHLFVSILCTIWAARILAPPHLQSYGGALAYALASCSNLYFWSEAGYFNAVSSTKPLLHTWSLGVEEQFYLVWPAALVLALRSRRSWMAPSLLSLAGVVSLAMNQVFADGFLAVANRAGLGLPDWLAAKEWLSDGQAALFYLLPFRVFEFAIGGILVWLLRFKPRDEALLDACVATGLALVAVAVFAFDEKTVFPSYSALVPCVGAALCIFAGQARRAGLILRNRASVRIGLMSYSLYLVHWPLIAFCRYSRTGDLTLFERVGIVVISFSLAMVMLKWVEQPFRRSPASGSAKPSTRWQRATLPGLFAVTACLFVVGVSMWSGDGWAWRFSDTVVAEEMKFRADEFRIYVWKHLRDLEMPFSTADGPKMLVVGDSQAADFVNIAFGAGLNDEFEIRSIPILDSCGSILPLEADEYTRDHRKPSCPEQNRKAAADPNWQRADVVVIAFLWDDNILGVLRRQMVQLRRLAPGARFVLVGPKAQEISGIDLLNRIAHDPNPVNLGEYRTVFPDLQRLSLHNLRAAAAEMGVPVFDVTELFCSASRCLRFNEFGNMLIYDEMHLTPKGAEFLGRRLRSRIHEYPYFEAREG